MKRFAEGITLKKVSSTLARVEQLGLDKAREIMDETSKALLKLISDKLPEGSNIEDYCRGIRKKVLGIIQSSDAKTSNGIETAELVDYERANIGGAYHIASKKITLNIWRILFGPKKDGEHTAVHEKNHEIAEANAQKKYSSEMYETTFRYLPLQIIEGCTELKTDIKMYQVSNIYVEFKAIVSRMAEYFSVPKESLAELYEGGCYATLLILALQYQPSSQLFPDLKDISDTEKQKVLVAATQESPGLLAILEKTEQRNTTPVVSMSQYKMVA